MRLIVKLFAGYDVDRLRHIKQRRVGLCCGHRICSNIAVACTGNNDCAAVTICTGVKCRIIGICRNGQSCRTGESNYRSL